MLPSEQPKCNLPGYAICPICGKRFKKPVKSVYKGSYLGKRYQMCSYACCNKFDEEVRCKKYEAGHKAP